MTKFTVKPELFNNPKNRFLIYNSYALFIQHLYEYLLGCFERDYGIEAKGETSEELISQELKKMMNNCVRLIENNKAPPWVNAHEIDFYKAPPPEDFACHFREMRNSIAHVKTERIKDKLPIRKKRCNPILLSEFYKRYHKYIMILFHFGREWWELDLDNLDDTDLGDVTTFAEMVLTT